MCARIVCHSVLSGTRLPAATCRNSHIQKVIPRENASPSIPIFQFRTKWLRRFQARFHIPLPLRNSNLLYFPRGERSLSARFRKNSRTIWLSFCECDSMRKPKQGHGKRHKKIVPQFGFFEALITTQASVRIYLPRKCPLGIRSDKKKCAPTAVCLGFIASQEIRCDTEWTK